MIATEVGSSLESPLARLPLRRINSCVCWGCHQRTYPELRSISVDRDAAEISIDVANYDEIVWISGAATWRYDVDPETGLSWPPGVIVQRGPVFNYSGSGAALPYVRAELILHSENGPIRLFLNPFALADP